VWLRRLWLHVPCRKIPVSRHPPTRAKSGPCAANKIGDYKVLKDGLVSPLDDISDLDLNYLESDNNSEYIFPLSPGPPDDASNGKPVSTPPLYNTDIPSKDLHSRITSAKDIQFAFTIAGSSNTSLKIAGEDCGHWLKRSEPCDQARDRENEIRLCTIPKEPE
jgi:hypothetical protein